MVFSSATFLFIFLPMVLLLYFGVPARWRGIRYRNAVLLLASLLFYAWGEPAFVFVMLAAIAVNWLGALAIGSCEGDRRKARRVLVPVIALDVSLIFVFKYLSFLLSNAGMWIGARWNVDIALPIGISFFTFQLMSYIFDVYRGKVKASRSLFDVALYISLFPQLIAGPIVQYSDIEAEIKSRRETAEDFCAGLLRFAIGLGKKVLLADFMAVIADNLFRVDALSSLSAASAWLGALAFTLQIYFDFSGYSDMAIGLGRMFGFHIKENFDHPHTATSVTGFWRKWHISLTGWFREYVYIPLGGSRRGYARTLLNIAFVWLLTGVWHGANWTYFLWGAYFCVILIAERHFGLANRQWRSWGKVAAWSATMILMIISFVIFRAESLGHAAGYLAAMTGANGAVVDDTFLYYIANGWALILAAMVLTMPIRSMVRRLMASYGNGSALLAHAGEIAYCLVAVVIYALSVCVVIDAGYTPFIYFNF